MAYTNNYITRAACDLPADWTAGTANSSALVVNNTQQVQGGGCLELRAASAIVPPEVCYWYYDMIVSNRFKITQEDLLMWFYYVKGKGQQYITNNAYSCTIRVFFGGTVKYADYYQGGDVDLAFGWQVFTASGRNSDAIGGGHNNGTDWDLDIHRFELRLEFNEHNTDGGTQDPRPALYMDYWRTGTKIVVSEGTPGVPVDFSGLQTYNDNNALGVVQISDTFINLLCGLDIGNGSDGTDAEGNLTDAGKFILFNQLSEEVKHNLVIENYSTLQLGTLEIGTDGSYPVNGCQLTLPASRYSDIDVKSGGSLKLYDTKIYRWRDIFLGNGGAGELIDLRIIDVDSCETVYFRQTNMILDTVEVHDNSGNNRDHSGEVTQTPTSTRNISVHDCIEGFHFRGSVDWSEYIAGDNTNYDLAVLEGETVNLINSIFSLTKLKRAT